MYYERLINIYHNSECHSEFSEEVLALFDNFIRDEKNMQHKYLNPYKFALKANFSIAESIKFFLYFTGQEKLLTPLPFIDCFSSNCTGVRLFFKHADSIEEGIIICESCGKEYLLDEIRKFILIYFELNPDIEIPEYQKNLSLKDPNSTYDILQGMPDILKGPSPLSLINIDEGEFLNEAVSLDQVIEQNKTISGNSIINPSDIFEIKLRERLSRGRLL